MYIFIYEDWNISKQEKVTGDDLKAADNGYLDIIDIGDFNPLRYMDGKWNDIETT